MTSPPEAVGIADRKPHIGRRDLLAVIGACAGAAVIPMQAAATVTSDGLHARAARRGLSFGCAVRDERLRPNDVKAAILRDAGMIVPENSMKWRETQKTSRAPNYIMADRIANFASKHSLLLRGHTVIWHQKPPAWALETLDGPGGRDLLLSYTRDIVGHFAGRVMEWDVVNEAIWTKDGLPNGIRNWPPYRDTPYDFMADCFIAAHEADPKAILCYNDFGLEYDNQTARRSGVLRILTELKHRKAPIHCLGIQSHLTAGWHFDEVVFRKFLAEVADLGLKIRLTELDVDDKNLPLDIAKRDASVAEVVRRYLSVAFDEPAVTGLLTWGLTDRFFKTKKDGRRPRFLPLDDNLQRKPVWYAIADSFDNAPIRS